MAGYLQKPPFPVLDVGHPLARGLVGCWSVYEGGGLTLHDVSCRQNHGTFGEVNSAKPTWARSVFGHSIFCDDAGYVLIPHDADQTGDKLTAEVWFDIEALASVPGRYYYVMLKPHGDPVVSWCLYVDDADDKLTVIVYDDSKANIDIKSDSALVSGTLYHAVLTIDGTATMYLNAVAQADTDTTATVYPATGNLFLSYSAGDYQLDGHIHKAAMWNRALSQQEISLLYHDPFCHVRSKSFNRLLCR